MNKEVKDFLNASVIWLVIFVLMLICSIVTGIDGIFCFIGMFSLFASAVCLCGAFIVSAKNKILETKNKYKIQDSKDSLEQMNEIKQQDSKDLCEQIDEIKQKLEPTMQPITNKIALVNLGIERYHRPTITYNGKAYNSKTLFDLLDSKNNFTMNDMIMCKMMIVKIEEQIDMIAKKDEHGEILRNTDDEILDAYLTFAKGEVCKLEYLLKKSFSR